MSDARRITPGSLREMLDATAARAAARGAVRPIRTELRYADDGGVRFVVRKVSSLQDKARESVHLAANPLPGNPFLPPDPDLLVGALSDTHVAVLNKFNVIDRHLLIVTREFEDQESLLTSSDFAALAACLREFDSLGFYNGGRAGGASQMHKHLQLVGLPLAPDGPAIPIEPLMVRTLRHDMPFSSAGLPVRHAAARLDPALFDRAIDVGEALHERYLALLRVCGLDPGPTDRGPRQSGPYNLLLRRDWMLLVARSREHWESVSVNALGFAGSLFVKDDAQLGAVLRAGPMAVLRAVGLPISPNAPHNAGKGQQIGGRTGT